MTTPCRQMVCLVLLTCCLGVTARAQTLVVATTGRDTNSGTAAAPFASLGRALAAARPGTRVLVRAGLYRGRVTVPQSGEPGRPIVIEGEPGAIIDGGDVVRGWEPAPEVGPGVYKLAGMPYVPWNMTWNNRYAIVINGTLMNDGGGFALLKKPATDTYWDGIEVLGGSREGVTYVRFRDGRNPETEDLTFAPRDEAALRLQGRHHIVVRGLTIRNAWNALRLDAGAADNVIENCRLQGGYITVFIKDGACRNELRGNEITLNYVFEDLGGPLDRDPVHAHVWHELYHTNSDQQAYGIQMSWAGDGNTIHDNRIFRHFDCFMDICGPLSWAITEADQEAKRPELAQHSRGVKIYNNLIDHAADECLNLFGGVVDWEIRDNVLVEATKLLSIRTPSTGPCYVYRNRIANMTETSWDGGPSEAGIRTYSQNLPSNRGLYYFYHNSISAGYFGVHITSGRNNPTVVGVPNFWFLDNAFGALRAFYADAPVNQMMAAHCAYNWVGSDQFGTADLWWLKPEQQQLNFGERGQRLWPDVWSQWAAGTMPALQVPAGSGAQRTGLDLSKPFTVDGVTRGPLPGMAPGYFRGKAPSPGWTGGSRIKPEFEQAMLAKAPPSRPAPPADSPAAAFVTAWGSAGTQPGQFSSPHGIAVSRRARVYVVDRNNHRVQVFTTDGRFVTRWGTRGSAPGQFLFPRGLAVDADENVYVADSVNQRVQKFTGEGKLLAVWGSGQEGPLAVPAEFNRPSGICAGPEGQILVADSWNYRVQVFSPAGALLARWGKQGTAPGLFSPILRGLACAGTGTVYVVDGGVAGEGSTGNCRVSAFGPEGGFLRVIGTRGTNAGGELNDPCGIAVDTKNALYVTDAGNSRIQRFGPEGEFAAMWGTYGSAPGQFRGPCGVACDDDGFVYVADTLNHRIQKFRLR